MLQGFTDVVQLIPVLVGFSISIASIMGMHIGITAKELLLVIVAATILGHRWSGKHVAFHVDNMTVLAVLHHQTATLYVA